MGEKELNKLKNRLEELCFWASNNDNQYFLDQNVYVQYMASQIYGIVLMGLPNYNEKDFKEFLNIPFDRLLNSFKLMSLLKVKQIVFVNTDNFIKQLLFVNSNYEELINNEKRYLKDNGNLFVENLLFKDVNPLKLIRISLNLSVRDISDMFSVSPMYFDKVENGDRCFDEDTLVHGLMHLNINLDDFYDLVSFCEQMRDLDITEYDKYKYSLIKCVGIINFKLKDDVDNILRSDSFGLIKKGVKL